MTPSDAAGSDSSSEEAPSSPTLLADYLLSAAEPGNIALIGCHSEDLHWPEELGNQHTLQRFDTFSSAELSLKIAGSANEGPSEDNTSVAVLNLGAENMAFEQQIGRAVRSFPTRLIVYTGDKAAPDTLFFSFGFRKLNVVEGAQVNDANRWYEYRLSHYKQPPDWLNARFWANPERFGIDEDSDVYSEFDDSDEEE